MVLLGRIVGALLWAAPCLFISAAAAAAPAAKPAPVSSSPVRRTAPWDPAFTRGTLPNGLSYVIAHNAKPTGAISIRLVVNAGSFDETPGERGVAHLIEHLAFRSTRHFANDEVERTLSANGIGFGRDFNAGTGLYGTFYQLDVARPNATSLDTAFRWLRDIGDGLTFSPADVESERRIVIAERQQALTRAMRFHDDVVRFQGGDLLSANRSPAGELSVLQAVTPTEVRAFHDRWYRPSAVTVIVAGDTSAADIKARIQAAFSDWQEPAAARASRRYLPPKPGRKLEVLVRSETGVPDLAVACRVAAADAPGSQTPATLRSQTASALWVRVINQRLAAIVATHKIPMIGAQMVAEEDNREFKTNCLVVTPIGDGWQAALQASEAELLRFERDGPSLAEVDRAIESERADLRGGITEYASRTSQALADALVAKVEDGDPLPEPREAMRDFDVAVEDMAEAEVRAAFLHDWRDSPGPLLIVNSTRPITPQVVTAAWSGAHTQAGAFAELKDATWPYSAASTPGKVVQTQRLQPDFTRFTFKNGLVVNYKKTSLEKDKIAIRLAFGYGRSEIPKGGFFAATLGSQTFFLGGLGKVSAAEIARLYPYSSANFKMAMGDHRFAIASSGVSDTLDNQLSILTAYVSDPGFRADVDPMISTAVEYGYRSAPNHPDVALALKIAATLWPGSEAGLPPQAVAAKLSARDLAAALKGAVTQAPLELTVVGDVSEGALLKAVTGSLGALPPRKASAKVRGDEAFCRYPERPFPPITTTYAGGQGTAVAHMVWPLYVAAPARRREEYTLTLLAGVLSERVRRRVREELGMTYSPGAETHMPDFADQGSLYVRVETAPADLARVTHEVDEIAAKLAKGEITAEMLEAVRQPILAHASERMSSNAAWAAALDGSAQDDQGLKDMLDYDTLMGAITLDEVKAAAAKWLSKPPLIATAIPVEGAAKP